EVEATGGDGAVDLQRGVAARCGHRLAERLLEEGAERPERVLAQGDAGRHGVAAALEQHAVRDRLAHGAAEIDSGNGAARAGADAAGFNGNRESGTAVALLQPCGNETDDAVPLSR